jgi:hypothetical protein
MKLQAGEFIRRFMLHVLPSRYVRIRHFGLLANRNRKEKISSCREFLRTGKTVTKEKIKQETWQEQLLRICGIDVTICPVCQKGRMSRIALLLPYRCNSLRSYSDECCSQFKNHVSRFLRKKPSISP